MNPQLGTVVEGDPEKRAELLLWQDALEQVACGKINWDLFLQKLGSPVIAHPAARTAATRDGQSLLHLAVLHEKHDLIRELARIASLRAKRNGFGLTPLEMAQFLDKKECAAILGSVQKTDFTAQPNVSISDEIKPHFSGLEYSTHPIFEPGSLFNLLIKTKNAKLKDAIPPEKIWMGVYFEKEIQDGLHPPVTIRYIDADVGYGVFTEKKIPPCAYVGEYTGAVQERKRKHLQDKYYCIRYTTWEMGNKNFVIDAEKRGNFTRFINHSAKPNLGLQSVYWRGLPRMVFVALKEIAEGTQLTFDYGNLFWKECPQIPKLF